MPAAKDKAPADKTTAEQGADGKQDYTAVTSCRVANRNRVPGSLVRCTPAEAAAALEKKYIVPGAPAAESKDDE